MSITAAGVFLVSLALHLYRASDVLTAVLNAGTTASFVTIIASVAAVVGTNRASIAQWVARHGFRVALLTAVGVGSFTYLAPLPGSFVDWQADLAKCRSQYSYRYPEDYCGPKYPPSYNLYFGELDQVIVRSFMAYLVALALLLGKRSLDRTDSRARPTEPT